MLLSEQSIYWENFVSLELDIKPTIWFLSVEYILHEYLLSLGHLFSVEAGYVATPIAMVQAAMTLLNDAADLPKA